MIRFSLTTAAAVVLAVTLYVAGAVTSPPIALAGPTQCAEQGEAGCARNPPTTLTLTTQTARKTPKTVVKSAERLAPATRIRLREIRGSRSERRPVAL